MLVNIKEYLNELLSETYREENDFRFSNVLVDTDLIQCVMINEVPPINPEDDFYSNAEDPDYMKTTRQLFCNAGAVVTDMDDILNFGIYITAAVKVPKQGYEVSKETITQSIPLLEAELALFPNLKAIMLMGDVAKKAFHEITKRKGSKRVIPTGSTYRIREGEYYYDGIRIFPSYIMTGGNILIEKSKRTMIEEDISKMMKIIT